MLMIEPRPFFSMPGRKARDTRYIDFTLTANAWSQSLGLGVEDRAVVDDAGAVEQHIDVTDFRRELLDRALVGHVEHPGLDALFAVELADGLGIHIARPDFGALFCERERGGAAHALAGGGDESGFPC